MSPFRSKPRLMDELVRAGLLTRPQAAEAAAQFRTVGVAPALWIVEHLGVDEARLLAHLAERLAVPVVGSESLGTDETALAAVPSDLLARGDLLPLRKVGATLTVAMADPGDSALRTALARRTKLKILPVLAPPTALREAHRRLEALSELRRDNAQGSDLRRYLPFFEHLPDYRFQAAVGHGGFGLVCRCWQVSLGRPVAIKVLDPAWSLIAQVTERFRREGQIIAHLDHPAIIRVHEQGERNGIRFIVMEYFEGAPLHHYLDAKDWGRKLSVLIQVCQAVAYAHDRGVIHRDIKPANILVNELGAIKLLDFGVAHHDVIQASLTGSNVVLGTPKYMAPELHQGADRASPASDIYAFGVMAYEILTRHACRPGNLVHPTQSDARIPRFLGDLILRCMSSAPADRPASFAELAGAFQQAMDQILFGDADGARRPGDTAVRQARMQSIEQHFKFMSVLRQGNRVRTAWAFNHNLGRDVVIKFIDSPQGFQRLQDYADLHELHIGEIYGIGRQGRLYVIVREWFERGPLRLRMGRDNPPGEIVDWISGVVQALAHAAKAALVHGNLHPNNLMFSDKGVIKVVDFGRSIEGAPDYPQYRPPRGGTDPGGQGTDRYALGVLTYELLTGENCPVAPRHGDLFARVSIDPDIHPLLKYFLGRLWNAREPYPPYPGYHEMLVDLERIRCRLESMPDWLGADDPPGLVPARADAPHTLDNETASSLSAV